MACHPILTGNLVLVGPVRETSAAEVLLQEATWQHLAFESIPEAVRYLRAGSPVDALVIVPGDEHEPYLDFCRHIRFSQTGAHVVILFVLPKSEATFRLNAYQAGANDVIEMPVTSQEMSLRLLNAIQSKRATDSLENAMTVITSLAKAIEGKDAYTCGHVERVATYAVEIARRVGVGEDDMAALRVGAFVHDIGKIIIPDHVLNKPGRLTDEEMANMKRHPIIGYQILEPLRTFQKVLPIVRWHHERPNGQGYPDGLAGEALPLLPRIVAVADCFDAIGTDRPYRKAMPLDQCIDVLTDAGEKGDLDAELVHVLFDIIGQNVPAPIIAAR